VARERAAVTPLQGWEEAEFVGLLDAVLGRGLCRPGEDGEAERARVDARLSVESWTSGVASDLGRAARGCAACAVASSCAALAVRMQQATGMRWSSVVVAGRVLSYRTGGAEPLTAAGAVEWAALPLVVAS
jgi:hypothetical protein